MKEREGGRELFSIRTCMDDLTLGRIRGKLVCDCCTACHLCLLAWHNSCLNVTVLIMTHTLCLWFRSLIIYCRHIPLWLSWKRIRLVDVRPHEGVMHWVTDSSLGCTSVMVFLALVLFCCFYSLWLFGEFLKFCTCLIWVSSWKCHNSFLVMLTYIPFVDDLEISVEVCIYGGAVGLG